ncbi:MAG: TIM barrel protein [Thermomicrobiales bacterium]
MSDRARVLLKARPTPAQIADRLAPLRPEGLELYLDARDLAPDDWLPRLRAIMAAAPRAGEDGFAYIVEGPIRSLDGEFFDVTRGAAADLEALTRLAQFGADLGAKVAVIHLIAPTSDPAAIRPERRGELIARALPLLERYIALCHDAGLTPTIENIPPIAQMREGAAVFSALGVEPEDLVRCCAALPGLGITYDTSHAGLHLEAIDTDPSAAPPELRPAVETYRATATVRSQEAWIDRVAPWLVNCHISNAAGLLGEGLPYGEGRFDLDALIPRLAATARYIVTETLEPDHDRAVFMREAYGRIMAALGGRLEGSNV